MITRDKEGYIISFGSYDELPFSNLIKEQLFKRHSHACIYNEGENDEIVYAEKDVLILLQMMQNELKFNKG